MAKGNWRSGNGHGVAEVGSQQRIFDGDVMKVSNTFVSDTAAHKAAKILEEDGYRTNVTKGRTKWTVWRTYHKVQTSSVKYNPCETCFQQYECPAERLEGHPCPVEDWQAI